VYRILSGVLIVEMLTSFNATAKAATLEARLCFNVVLAVNHREFRLYPPYLLDVDFHISPLSSLQFEMSASDSAILVMPKGAYRKAVKSIRNMRDYMTPSTIESWYKYAVKVRGRDLQNGDIRLVYACDKAPSWGIATVSGTNGRPVSLTFKEVKDQGTYEWEYNGTADIARRVGPCRDENRDLDGVVHNQCLFLRTLNAQFSDQRWKEIEIELSLASRMKKFAVRSGNDGLVSVLINLFIYWLHLQHRFLTRRRY